MNGANMVLGFLLFFNVVAVFGHLFVADVPFLVYLNLLGCVMFGIWIEENT